MSEYRITVLQPPYPEAGTIAAAAETVEWCLSRLASIEARSTDLVVLPEYANVAGIATRADADRAAVETTGGLLEAIGDEAKRICATVCCGIYHADPKAPANRTTVIRPDGMQAHYDKTHLTDAERDGWGLVAGDTLGVFEHEGIRIGIAVCFEMYFPEYFEAIAAQRPDIILVPSYQRSEDGWRIDLLSACRALDSGAYLARASYARVNAGHAGHSLIAAPDGSIVANLGKAPGMMTVSVDPKRRYRKPAHHRGPETEHRSLIDAHRRSELYRADGPAPSADRSADVEPAARTRLVAGRLPASTSEPGRTRERIALPQERPFPRLCAHRGLSSSCPENTLVAFGAAIALGVEEIELDVRLSADGVPVVCHDSRVDRTTNGTGDIAELSWDTIRSLDAGAAIDGDWSGVRMCRFEEVASLAAGKTVMNVHLKAPGPDGMLVRVVHDVLNSTGTASAAYLAGDEDVLSSALSICPDVDRACLASQRDSPRQVDIAKAYRCSRIQFFREVDDASIAAAREAGIICNLIYSDEEQEARAYVARGIDVVLTNRAHAIRLP